MEMEHHASDHLVTKRCMAFGSHQPREVCTMPRPQSADFIGPRTYDLEPHEKATFAKTLFGSGLRSITPLRPHEITAAAASPAPGAYSPPPSVSAIPHALEALEAVIQPGIGAGATPRHAFTSDIVVAPGGLAVTDSRLHRDWYTPGAERMDLGPGMYVPTSSKIVGGVVGGELRYGIRTVNEIREDAQRPGPGRYDIRSDFAERPGYSETLHALERARPIDWTVRAGGPTEGAEGSSPAATATRSAMTSGTNGAGTPVFLHCSNLGSLPTPTFGSKRARFAHQSLTYHPGPGAHPYEAADEERHHAKSSAFGRQARPKQMPGTQSAEHPAVGLYELAGEDIGHRMARSLNLYGAQRLTEAAKESAARWSRIKAPVCTQPLAEGDAPTPKERRRAQRMFMRKFQLKRPSVDRLLASTGSRVMSQ